MKSPITTLQEEMRKKIRKILESYNMPDSYLEHETNKWLSLFSTAYEQGRQDALTDDFIAQREAYDQGVKDEKKKHCIFENGMLKKPCKYHDNPMGNPTDLSDKKLLIHTK